MATQKDDKDKLENPGESMGLAGSGNLAQHNDWGHSDAGSKDDPLTAGVPSTGGVGHRHRDWGHSDVGNAQAGQGESYQGVLPGEEAGELQPGLGGVESLSTGNAGSMHSDGETATDRKKARE
jgi:hypothetical protein